MNSNYSEGPHGTVYFRYYGQPQNEIVACANYIYPNYLAQLQENLNQEIRALQANISTLSSRKSNLEAKRSENFTHYQKEIRKISDAQSHNPFIFKKSVQSLPTTIRFGRSHTNETATKCKAATTN